MSTSREEVWAIAWVRLDLRMQTVLARLYAKAGVVAPWACTRLHAAPAVSV